MDSLPLIPYSKLDSLIGKPFKFGGRGPDFYDCYGVVIELYKMHGIIIPDYPSPEIFEEIDFLIKDVIQKSNWVKQEKIIPNSVLVFNLKGLGSHVSYLLNNFDMIHCWEHTNGVTIENIYNQRWTQKVIGCYKWQNL